MLRPVDAVPTVESLPLPAVVQTGGASVLRRTDAV